ncbi:hypothetical protein ABK040_009463 [Willaertia magna]
MGAKSSKNKQETSSLTDNVNQQHQLLTSLHNNLSYTCQQYTCNPQFHKLISFESNNIVNQNDNFNINLNNLSASSSNMSSINCVTTDGMGFELNNCDTNNNFIPYKEVIYFKRIDNDRLVILTKDKVILKGINYGEESSTYECEFKLPMIKDQFIKLASENGLLIFLLTSTGKLFIRGSFHLMAYGILKDLEFNEFTLYPYLENVTNKIIDVKCGQTFCVIRCENGDCFGAGECYNNCIGIICALGRIIKTFRLIEELKGRVKQHDCGKDYTVYLTFDGELYGCGMLMEKYFKKNNNNILLTKISFNNGMIRRFKSVLVGEKCSVFISLKNTFIYCFDKTNDTTNVINDNYIEFDVGLDKYIGNFGMKRNEMIEFGVVSQFCKGMIVCNELFADGKNLQLFYDNLMNMNYFIDIKIIL